MAQENYRASVLVVSSTDKILEFFTKVLPLNQFNPIDLVKSCGEAKRLLINKPYDIVVINSPLSDEFGSELAIEIATKYNSGVLMLIKAEAYEQVTYQVENYGVLTMSRPCQSHAVFQSMKILMATKIKLRAMEEKTASLEEKMKEIRIVNHAKGILIEKLHLTENEAHRYIEKNAMDQCVKKVDIAYGILEHYGIVV